ncbi:unnamed protein product [Boreogadus saida]
MKQVLGGERAQGSPHSSSAPGVLVVSGVVGTLVETGGDRWRRIQRIAGDLGAAAPSRTRLSLILFPYGTSGPLSLQAMKREHMNTGAVRVLTMRKKAIHSDIWQLCPGSF